MADDSLFRTGTKVRQGVDEESRERMDRSKRNKNAGNDGLRRCRALSGSLG